MAAFYCFCCSQYINSFYIGRIILFSISEMQNNLLRFPVILGFCGTIEKERKKNERKWINYNACIELFAFITRQGWNGQTRTFNLHTQLCFLPFFLIALFFLKKKNFTRQLDTSNQALTN